MLIKIGATYIFKKSGSLVKVLESGSVKINLKTKVQGFVVERVDTGKQMFCPADSLIDPSTLES